MLLVLNINRLLRKKKGSEVFLPFQVLFAQQTTSFCVDKGKPVALDKTIKSDSIKFQLIKMENCPA